MKIQSANGMDTKIAPEIWLFVGEYSRKQDLNSLSLASKLLSNILRPLLYRFVDLH